MSHRKEGSTGSDVGWDPQHGGAEPLMTVFEQRGGDQSCLELVGERMVDEKVEVVAIDN